MEWISFGALPCRNKNLMTARVSTLLKSRASLTCFRACFLPVRAKDLSAPRCYTHISDCVHTVYELPLLPDNTVSETFLHKTGEVRRVDWTFITGPPAWRWLGEHVTLDKAFSSLLYKQEAVAAAFTYTFSFLSHSSWKPFLICIIFMLWFDYTILDIICINKIILKVKVNQSRYRPGVAQRVPGS